MKKFFKIFGISLGVVFTALIVGYFYISFHYSDSFSYGTKINGLDCTGLSVDEINSALMLRQEDYKGLQVLDKNGEEYFLSAGDVAVSFNYLEPLYDLYFNQNSFLWGLNLLPDYIGYTVEPVFSYNEELFNSAVDNFGIWEEEIPDSDRKIEIVQGEDGFELLNNRTGVFRQDIARQLIKDSFEKFEPSVDLMSENCYVDLSIEPSMQKEIETFQKIDKFQTRDLTLVIGDEEIPLDKKTVDSFILYDENSEMVFDENGDLLPDESKIDEYVDSLAQKYNTVGIDRKFQTTEGRIVTVSGGDYGNEINDTSLKEYLKQAISENTGGRYEVEMKHTARAVGENDIGDTYVEVDMGNQHLYYYENGVLTVDSDIVTGNERTKCLTPTGTYYVKNKGRNVTLTGATYQSFVKYWIAVIGNKIGIHDASWRHGKFGGEIYKTNGSHGCINTREDEVSQIYERIEKGVPVVMFY